MIRVIVAVVVVLGAVSVAQFMKRRDASAPTQGGFQVPTQLDRNDFPEVTTPWLVAVFTSATCSTCADVFSKASVLACADVAVHEVEYTAAKSLHAKYGIDAVPALVVADDRGVVRSAFLGPVKAQDLWAAVAECREPGSTPEPQLGHEHDR
ncbi:MAG: hypothetical protein FJW98_00625 [Actinobacteria bacterium]|nr:hypothetical protein [Actinomycetota bacterium]